MYLKYPYVESELKVVDYLPGIFGGPPSPIKNYPIAPRTNFEALMIDKKPYWLPVTTDAAFIMDPWNNHMGRGGMQDFVDDFGITWVYEPVAGGSIVRGDMPQLLDDVNNWKEKVKLPDIDSWEWEECAKNSKIDMRFSTMMSFTNGFWFERLISFMGFMPAAMALIDDEQTDAIHELFGALTDLGCKIIDKYCEYFPQIDIFNVHDDWGSQMAPFFSEEVARELFLPYMKQICDHIHSKGRIASLHSCGHNDSRVHIFVEAGFDEWQPQDMNDIDKMYKEYGDKIVLSVFPDRTDLATASEEEQRQAARDMVDKYSEPGKPVTMSFVGLMRSTPVFLDELYAYSRKKYYDMYAK